MNKKLLIIISIIHLLFSCSEEESTNEPPSQKEEDASLIQYKRYDYSSSELISIDDYKELAKTNKQIVLIDVRKSNEFEQGHIVKAQNIWRPEIRDEENTTEGLMASQEKMEALLSKLGATPESFIVIYDAKGNPDAARLWWILKYYGHEKVALLDGGLTNWKSNNMPLTTQNYIPEATEYKFKNEINESYYASKELVQQYINDTNYILIDTRCLEEFSGKDKKGNAGNSGRIPNSILINYDNNINYNSGLTFKNESELIELYKDIDPNKNIITYCQSGVRSAQTTFVLTKLMGFKNVKNYDGSWLEWSNDTTLPIQQDSTLTIK